MSYSNSKNLNRAMEAGISNDQEACLRAFRLPSPDFVFGGVQMFHFIGSDGDRIIFFKENFLNEIEKVRKKLCLGESTILFGRPIFTLLTEYMGKVLRLCCFSDGSLSLVEDDTVLVQNNKLPNLVEFLDKAFSIPEDTRNQMLTELRKNLSRQRPQDSRSKVSA